MDGQIDPAGNGVDSSTEKKTNRAKKRRKILSISILIVVVTAVSWHFIRISQIQSHSEELLMKQEQMFIEKMDSLGLENSLQASTLLSWAVRGEMLRGNKEQVRQYFNEFIKTENVLSIQLIDPMTGVVALSTNAKSEGAKNRNYNKVTSQMVEVDSSFTRIVTPITSLNNVMNVLLIDVQRINSIENEN